MTDHTQNPTAATSAAEAELARIEARRLELLEQVEQERLAREQAPRPMRQLAVTLHANLCPNTHDGVACRWFSAAGADDPDAADWTEPAHAFWLACVHAAVSFAQLTGWTVEPPDPESEEAPEP